MIKPKLAEGSRWEGDLVIDAGGAVTGVENVGTRLPFVATDKAGEREGTFVSDALAVIRAAGIDPVWSAAVKLRQYVGSPGAMRIGIDELISKLCDAVDVSGEKESDDA